MINFVPTIPHTTTSRGDTALWGGPLLAERMDADWIRFVSAEAAPC